MKSLVKTITKERDTSKKHLDRFIQEAIQQVKDFGYEDNEHMTNREYEEGYYSGLQFALSLMEKELNK